MPNKFSTRQTTFVYTCIHTPLDILETGSTPKGRIFFFSIRPLLTRDKSIPEEPVSLPVYPLPLNTYWSSHWFLLWPHLNLWYLIHSLIQQIINFPFVFPSITLITRLVTVSHPSLSRLVL